MSTHRPQGHAMAKGASPRSIFCEMLGRMGGPSNGTSGPMQWVDADHNFFCGSIVGSGSCYANGFALSLKRQKKGHICACFFGDGASSTGASHEGMNLASVWKLPLLFVCENNQYGQATPMKNYCNVDRLSQRAAGYGIPGVSVDGMDVMAVAEVAAEAIERIRNGNGPCLIEAVTYRFKGHYIGDPLNYRTKEEVERWQKKDPLIQCRKNLVENWGYTDAQLKAVEEEIAQQIARDEAWALEQPKPTLEYAISNVMVPVAGRKA
ncbi:MAG: thiamine pyrophosphate-dependent dehydrogenase E1 component subunit alpha [Atribacterota bacterium]